MSYIYKTAWEQSVPTITTVSLETNMDTYGQGYNARKVIWEVYASFVLQCTVSGR